MDVDPSIWNSWQRFRRGEKVYWVFRDHGRSSEELLKGLGIGGPPLAELPVAIRMFDMGLYF